MKKIFNKKNLFSLILVVLASLLQTYCFQVFLLPANMVSAGFTGVAIIINKIFSNVSIAFLIIALNLPVALICLKGISVRFTIFSTLQFVLTSVFLNICSFNPLFTDIILNVIFGGFLNGIAVVLALKADASTGGTDFIALFFSNKFNKSLWNEVFFFNATLIVIFGFQEGWVAAGYSILYQYIATLTINRFHQRYRRVTMQIMTKKPKEILHMYTTEYRHGITCAEGYGGYSGAPITTLTTVVSSYEIKEVEKSLLEIDPNCLINEFVTNKFIGRFYVAPIK